MGSAQLAAFAEADLHGAAVADRLIAAGDRALFPSTMAERRTDTVVLACTHYPLLLDRLERLAPWPVAFIDPAPAIARRVVDLSGPPAGVEPAVPRASCSPPAGSLRRLAAALERFGIGGELGKLAPDRGIAALRSG